MTSRSSHACVALLSLALSGTSVAAVYQCSTYRGDEMGSNFRYLDQFSVDVSSGRQVNRYVASDLVASCLGRAGRAGVREIVCGFVRYFGTTARVMAMGVSEETSYFLTTDTLHHDNYRYRIHCVR